MRVYIFIFILLGAISMGAQSSNPKPVKIKITGDIDSTYQATSLVIVRQNDNIRKPTAEIPVEVLRKITWHSQNMDICECPENTAN